MNFRFVTATTAIGGLILTLGTLRSAQAQTDSEPTLENSLPPAARQTPPLPLIPPPPADLPQLTREQRQQAYAKLLEGQRYLWALQNLRSQNGVLLNGRAARAALQKAVTLNPGLAEAYTALAEIAFFTQNNLAEVERLAGYAIRFDRDNFGAHQLLARVYTRRSKLYSENYEPLIAPKAIAEWREITRLDERSAEAWAFLSDFYAQNGQTDNQILALEKWGNSSTPLDDRFYQAVSRKESLAPDAAISQLGAALLKAGRNPEAVKILLRAVAENGGDEAAANALETAIETTRPEDAAKTLGVLQTAAAANPSDFALSELLINAKIRAGQIDEAAGLLRNTANRLSANDKTNAARFLIRLGSVYADAERSAEAIKTYQEALDLLSINDSPLAAENERNVAAAVLPRLTSLYKQSGQDDKARQTINRLKSLLGAMDATADEQLIELSRAEGDFPAALKSVRDARRRFPEDQSLLQLEANVLTDMNRVDEAVALLRSKIVNKTAQISVPQTLVNDFLSNITISNLYTRASRGAEAIAAAQAARDLAQTPQMTNIAVLTLATAQNSAGNFKSAEFSLREILKQEPDNATALNNLGYFMVERGERLSEAVDLIKRAVSREPNNSSFLDSLGWAQFKLGQFSDAEKNLTAAARRSPNSAAIQHHLGDVYERQNKIELARAAWQKALTLTKEAAEMNKIKTKINGSSKNKSNK